MIGPIEQSKFKKSLFDSWESLWGIFYYSLVLDLFVFRLAPFSAPMPPELLSNMLSILFGVPIVLLLFFGTGEKIASFVSWSLGLFQNDKTSANLQKYLVIIIVAGGLASKIQRYLPLKGAQAWIGSFLIALLISGIVVHFFFKAPQFEKVEIINEKVFAKLFFLILRLSLFLARSISLSAVMLHPQIGTAVTVLFLVIGWYATARLAPDEELAPVKYYC